MFFVFAAFGFVFPQAPELIWTCELYSQCYGSPACGDIDGDGELEVVFGTYFGDEHAYALNGVDGSVLWRFDVGGGPLDAAPALADVDGDGTPEVIIPASFGALFCIDGGGTVLWRYPSSGYIECIDSPPAVADIDGDGAPEVVFGAWYGKLYVVNAEDGSPVWSRVYCDTGYVQSAPCILDCNGDGALDVVFAMFRGDHRVYAVDGFTGDVLWSFPADDWMYAGASAADIDGDGKPEVVIGDYSGKVTALDAEDGSVLWQTDLGAAYYDWIFGPTTIAELSPASEGPEVLVARSELFCLSAEGEVLWTFPTGGYIDRGAVVAEVDGDGGLEVVFASTDRNIYVVNGEDGSLVWSFGVDDGYPVENAPVVADLDGDGYVDIFCIGGRGYSDTLPNYGRAYAVRAGVGGGAVWTMYRHDVYRSGCVWGGPSGVAQAKSSAPEPSISASPNPFNEVCVVVAQGCDLIRIFDLRGDVVCCASLCGGRFVWRPEAGLPAGVYIAVATGKGGRALQRRLVYAR